MIARPRPLTVPVPTTPTKPRRRRLGGHTLLAAVALLTLGACSNDDSGASDAAHNDADVAFATQMIPHHAQAVEMASMAGQQARSPEVIELAREIEQAQQPEIDSMSGWLSEWGEPVPSVGSATTDEAHGMDGMDSGETMPGMMSDHDMRTLSRVSGSAFDRLWLTMMVEHHRGAIDMAKTELSDGRSPDAQALAGNIIRAQQKEITTMSSLLESMSR